MDDARSSAVLMPNGEFSLESRVARAEQRLSDLDARVVAMTPMAASVIQLVEQVSFLRRDLTDYKQQFHKALEDRDDREEQIKKERRQARLAMWSLAVTILCALVGAAVVIFTGTH